MATRHRFGEAEDLVAVGGNGRCGRRGSQGVLRRACGDNANEMIPGGLVGSRVFRGGDDEHDDERVAGGQKGPGRRIGPGG